MERGYRENQIDDGVDRATRALTVTILPPHRQL